MYILERKKKTSQNHKIVKVGKVLCWSPGLSTAPAGIPRAVAQMAFEDLQTRNPRTSGQSMPVLGHLHSK